MTASTESASPFPTLYKHAKREHWGLALLAWQHNNKRGYLFQDGQLRAFGEEFCGMMEPIDQPSEEMIEICQRLVKDLGGLVDAKPASAAAADAMTFTEQVTVFIGDYPDGFAGEKWKSTMRGEGAKSVLKRHRKPVLEMAKEITEDALNAVAAEGPGAVWNRILELLRKTDLVPAKETRAVPAEDPAKLQALDDSIMKLLFQENDHEGRFDGFVKAYEAAHGSQPGWQLATVTAGLLFPSEHMVVRPGSFREQAKALQYRLKLGKPDGRTYSEALAMARQVMERLVGQGHSVQDLVDVHDFMAHTTRAAAKRQAFAQRASQVSSSDTPPAGGDDSESEEGEAA